MATKPALIIASSTTLVVLIFASGWAATTLAQPLPVSPVGEICAIVPEVDVEGTSGTQSCLSHNIDAERYCPEAYPRAQDESACTKEDFTDEEADTVYMYYCPSSCDSEDRTQGTMHNGLLDTNDNGGYWAWAHHFIEGNPTELDCDYFEGDNWGLDKLSGTISTDSSNCVETTLHANGRWTVGVDFR